MPNKTFIRITNNDIYNKINESIESNRVEHNEIIEHQIRTNGKVKLNRWIATTALSFSIILICWIINNLLGG